MYCVIWTLQNVCNAPKMSVLFGMNSDKKCIVLFCIKCLNVSELFHMNSKTIELLSKYCLSFIAIRKKIILIIFLILNTIFYFLMLMNTWQFHLSKWQRLGPMWAISISFAYVESHV